MYFLNFYKRQNRKSCDTLFRKFGTVCRKILDLKMLSKLAKLQKHAAVTDKLRQSNNIILNSITQILRNVTMMHVTIRKKKAFLFIITCERYECWQ